MATYQQCLAKAALNVVRDRQIAAGLWTDAQAAIQLRLELESPLRCMLGPGTRREKLDAATM